MKEKGINCEVKLEKEPHDETVGIKKSGCHGFCEMGPLVRIEPFGYLYIKVKDSGIGIPKNKLDDVFKLFKQVNNRITKLSEGSGIGLSIVKSLVNLHNGTISAYSEKDQGSEFVIKIPISMCEEKEFEKKTFKYNKYVENIDIEFSDIYTSIKSEEL